MQHPFTPFLYLTKVRKKNKKHFYFLPFLISKSTKNETEHKVLKTNVRDRIKKIKEQKKIL